MMKRCWNSASIPAQYSDWDMISIRGELASRMHMSDPDMASRALMHEACTSEPDVHIKLELESQYTRVRRRLEKPYFLFFSLRLRIPKLGSEWRPLGPCIDSPVVMAKWMRSSDAVCHAHAKTLRHR